MFDRATFPVPVLLAALAAAVAGRAETLQLKDGAAVTGKILAEKKDLVVVDLGFAVVSVPRGEIVRMGRDAASEPRNKSGRTPVVQEAKGGLYATATTPPPEKMVRELVQLLGQSVVQVRTPAGLGSGFFIAEDGHLVTNFHVIEGETKISLEVYHLKDGQLERRSYKDIRIVAMNKFADLALLKVEDKGAPGFKRVLLGDSDALAVGERVFAIGSPLGLERTVTEGILSTKTREVGGELYLQTTAQINPGNSGGPLFNLRGEVVGVTNMKLTFGEGIGFAIPVDQVKYFLNHRDAFAYDNDNPNNAFRYLEPPSRLRSAAP
ncbi:MAG: trypsin-like serine protease [Verrucomicrobia bacterium]|nr:MAG: trypsin-like serine protease [Verrucomicrobiota bacterium]